MIGLRSRSVAVRFAALLLALVFVGVACSSTNSSDGSTGIGDTAVELPDTTTPDPGPAVAVTAEPTGVSTAPPRPSSGCSATPPTPEASTGAQPDQKVTVDGVERTYRLYVPPSAGDGQPMPVVLNLHGLTSNIDQQVAVSQFEALAATEDFVVVTPQGLGAPARWGFKNDPQNEDLPFFSALLDQVEAQNCVDTARMYSSGISNGGMMSTTLACQMGDRIAAVGLVSGIRQPDDCTPTGKATPVMVFWGTKDAVLPYDGGLSAGLLLVLGLPGTTSSSAAPSTQNYGFPPVEQVVAEWAAHDGCGAEPTAFPVGTEVEERVYSGCTDAVEVRFYVVADGGHNWPGSKVMLGLDRSNAVFGITTDQVDATALIWKFFQGYALSS